MTPAFEARDGRVCWNSLPLSPEEASALLANLTAAAADPSDYFHERARLLRPQLAEAMEQVQ